MTFQNLAPWLVLLLMWGWVDDLFVPSGTPDPADDVATSENDRYLQPERRPGQGTADETGQSPHGLAAPGAGLDLISPAAGRPRRTAAPPLTSTDPLYAFMSLQR